MWGQQLFCAFSKITQLWYVLFIKSLENNIFSDTVQELALWFLLIQKLFGFVISVI